MNVLIVDDNSTNRKLLRVLLESESHSVLEAADGVEALKILEARPVEAVVSDILMPNMDGFQLCLEIRNHPRLRPLPFIIYTSTYDSPSDRGLAKAVGADHYIVKPAPATVIMDALRETARVPTRQVPEPTGDIMLVLKQYNQGLVGKLESKNLELRDTLDKLQDAHSRIVDMNHQLEQRVEKRTAELSRANDDLNRRNSEIRSFYHTLSHELKTPLTSAREFAALVMEGHAGPVNSTQKEYLETTLQCFDQIHRCIDDLLDAARLDTGKLSLEIRRGPLVRVVQHAIKAVKSTVASKNIRFESNLTELPEIAFDEYRIYQVLTNLINNAIKFTPAGGAVTVSLSSEPLRTGFQRITVSDTGCGIPQDQCDLIFDRLYQVQQEDVAASHGLGIGLYLCRELVHLHGGEIGVESTPGRGSVFTFVLPEVPPTNGNGHSHSSREKNGQPQLEVN